VAHILDVRGLMGNPATYGDGNLLIFVGFWVALFGAYYAMEGRPLSESGPKGPIPHEISTTTSEPLGIGDEPHPWESKCPLCGAHPGFQCKTASGNPATTVHKVREPFGGVSQKDLDPRKRKDPGPAERKTSSLLAVLGLLMLFGGVAMMVVGVSAL
jgi:hypothetical protein